MRFRITARWELPDVLPSSSIHDSPTDAYRAAEAMRRLGMRIVSIESFAEQDIQTMSLYRLRALYQSERTKPSHRRRKRNHIASILFGILASALPNSFGDFGVFSGSSGLRAGRVTFAGKGSGGHRQR